MNSSSVLVGHRDKKLWTADYKLTMISSAWHAMLIDFSSLGVQIFHVFCYITGTNAQKAAIGSPLSNTSANNVDI